MRQDPEEARRLLLDLKAPARLVRHVEFVHEAALLLVGGIRELGVEVDVNVVETGALIHDLGKVEHPDELDGPGSQHERAGERILIGLGWNPDIARICWTHASWSDPNRSVEDLLVALSDKLWKGKRVEDLEERVIDALAAHSSLDKWELFSPLSDLFELVASTGDDRLSRSKVEAT